MPRCWNENWRQQTYRELQAFDLPFPVSHFSRAQPLLEESLIFLPNGGNVSHKKQPFHHFPLQCGKAFDGSPRTPCLKMRTTQVPRATCGLVRLFSAVFTTVYLMCVLYPFPVCCLPQCVIHHLSTWYKHRSFSQRLPAATARRWCGLQMANFEGGMPEPYIPPNKNTIYIRPAGEILSTPIYLFHLHRVPLV